MTRKGTPGTGRRNTIQAVTSSRFDYRVPVQGAVRAESEGTLAWCGHAEHSVRGCVVTRGCAALLEQGSKQLGDGSRLLAERSDGAIRPAGKAEWCRMGLVETPHEGGQADLHT